MRTQIAIVFLVFAQALAAQDVQVVVRTQARPHYVGDPVAIQFTVEGFDEEPQPALTIVTESGKLADGLRGQLSSVNPSVSSQIIPRNGRLYQSVSVTFQINYLVTAEKAGSYTIGPFSIKQGTKQATAESLSMSFEPVPADPDMRVRLILPNHPMYVDQRVPVKIEWWYAGKIDNVSRLNIYSPLFDQFRFGPDAEPTRQDSQLPIDTKDGRVSLAGDVREERADGRKYIVVSASRVMIPDRVGEFSNISISATARKVTAWQRSRSPFDAFEGFGLGDSMFGDLLDNRRTPARTELGQAVDAPHNVVIKPFPNEGRPASFSGGVGSGFSLDVAADRSVVRVGDPISLNITLKGDGNIDNARLPDLSADGGLRPDLFRLPEGEVAGTLEDGSKKFRVSVRVADESVLEIPSIAYSWFDPASESYQTTHSKPIALRVDPAKVIAAGDVVSRRDTSKTGGSTDQPNDIGQRETDPAHTKPVGFSLSGADLAIEPDARLVLVDSNRSQRSMWATCGLYAGGLLVLAIALVDRRRREQDPSVKATRRLIRDQQSRIVTAARLPRKQAAEEVAAALRQLISGRPDSNRDVAEKIIAQCDAIVYAPSNLPDQRLDETLLAQARLVAEAYRV